MLLKLLSSSLSVIQVNDLKDIDFSVTPLFIGKTEDELSVVMPTEFLPATTKNREDNWKALKIEGVLEFSLVGILAKIATILANHSISIFAISTYNTDYILIKDENLQNAIRVLSTENYTIEK